VAVTDSSGWCSTHSSCMVEFRERIWTRPTDSWDHLIMPLPLEYDTWCREKYTVGFLFIHCEHSVVIKTDSVIFWEFHAASVAFFLLNVGSTPSHAWGSWRQTCRCYSGWIRSDRGTLTPLLTFFKRHSVVQFWFNNHSRGRPDLSPFCYIEVQFSN
jgi:hypothetical protein